MPPSTRNSGPVGLCVPFRRGRSLASSSGYPKNGGHDQNGSRQKGCEQDRSDEGSSHGIGTFPEPWDSWAWSASSHRRHDAPAYPQSQTCAVEWTGTYRARNSLMIGAVTSVRQNACMCPNRVMTTAVPFSNASLASSAAPSVFSRPPQTMRVGATMRRKLLNSLEYPPKPRPQGQTSPWVSRPDFPSARQAPAWVHRPTPVPTMRRIRSDELRPPACDARHRCRLGGQHRRCRLSPQRAQGGELRARRSSGRRRSSRPSRRDRHQPSRGRRWHLRCTRRSDVLPGPAVGRSAHDPDGRTADSVAPAARLDNLLSSTSCRLPRRRCGRRQLATTSVGVMQPDSLSDNRRHGRNYGLGPVPAAGFETRDRWAGTSGRRRVNVLP
jgi:hypothetical protein